MMLLASEIVHLAIIVLLLLYLVVSFADLALALVLLNKTVDVMEKFVDQNSDKYSWSKGRRRKDVTMALGYDDTFNSAFTPIFNIYFMFQLITNWEQVLRVTSEDLILEINYEHKRQMRNKQLLEEEEGKTVMDLDKYFR